MADEFSNDILKKVVAQICQLVGFDGILTTPLLVLSDLLKRFISDLGRKTQQYSEHCGRTTLTVADLDLAFRDFQVCPEELHNFLTWVSPLPKSLVVPKFPVSKRHLNTLTIQENTPALQNNPIQESNNFTKPTIDTFTPKETLSTTLLYSSNPVEKISLQKEPLKIFIPKEKIELPKESLKIKISLGKLMVHEKKKKEKKKRNKKKKTKSKK